MSDQKQKQESTGAAPQTEEKKKPGAEISEEELKKVSGGQVNISDMNFTRKVDKSSPL